MNVIRQEAFHHPFSFSIHRMFSWLEQHLLPCAYKMLFGIECPVCGFQRSFLALLKGELRESFFLYPPLVPVLVLFLLLGLFLVTQKMVAQRVMVTYAWSVLAIVLINYIVKLFAHPLHTPA